MERVDRVNQTLAVLGRQLAERADRLGRLRSDAGAPAARRTDERSIAALRARIVERLRALELEGANDPRARRVIVESILAWEFGDEVIGDPRFTEVIDQVAAALDAHPDTDKRIGEMLVALSNT